MSNSPKITINFAPHFISLLTLLFIVLKLMGYITWSWWWVISPLWLPLFLIILTVAVVGAGHFFFKAYLNK